MKGTTVKLRLGPLPKTDTIKLTIALPVELKAMLDRYAELHGQIWSEPVDASTLIPHMLAVFMERDRGFKARRKAAAPSAASTNGCGPTSSCTTGL
jgi:hypothetical protein